MYRRVMVKISGEGLSGDTSGHFDEKTVQRVVSEVKELLKHRVEVALVFGGGNFMRGDELKPEIDKTKAHQMGMLSTIINGIYMSEHFRFFGIKAEVMTPFDICGFTKRFLKEEALKSLTEGKVLIFSGGTGHPFFTTDSIVAIRACELEVDAVLYAKSVPCIYDGNPEDDVNKKLRRFSVVSYETAVRKSLAVADISALDLTRKANIPSVVFDLSIPGSIIKAAKNDPVALFEMGGTIVANGVKEEYYE